MTMEEKKCFYGSRLTLLRFLNGVSETELAVQCDCSKQVINHIEKGRRQPKREKVLLFCEIFNVGERFFFDEKVNMEFTGNSFSVGRVSPMSDDYPGMMEFTVKMQVLPVSH